MFRSLKISDYSRISLIGLPASFILMGLCLVLHLAGWWSPLPLVIALPIFLLFFAWVLLKTIALIQKKTE